MFRWIRAQKKCLFVLLFFLAPLFSAAALAESNKTQLKPKLSAFALLQKMQQAAQTLDYQIYFYVSDRAMPISNENTFLYQHQAEEANERARLLYLDGVKKEIILDQNKVTYLQAETAPFAFNAPSILEAFPNIVTADLTRLRTNYQFKRVGKSRVANKMAEMIQITPNSPDRYSYLIWIDEETHLPLRSDLLDLNSTVIQQFKVLGLSKTIADPDFLSAFEAQTANTKPIDEWLSNDKVLPNADAIAQLPKGFEPISSSDLYFESQEMQSMFFSDGLFSFSMTLSALDQEDKDIEIESATSVYSTTRSGKNIVIMGSLPLATLKQIVDHFPFN